MSAWGNTDNQISVPKFPKERRARDVNQFVLTANTLTGANTLFIANANTYITSGMYVSGNNISVSSQVPGFFLGNVTVVSANSTAIIISNPVSANTRSGTIIYIDSAIAYDQTTDQKYYANTYLVNASRIANSTFANGATFNNSVAHTGWNRVVEGTGGRAGRISSETLVCISAPTINNANSGNSYFPGS